MSTDYSDSYGLPRPVVGWIHNHAVKNYWRVANWCELDDLIQDGLLVAYKCLRRYGEPGKNIDPPHFMALVKTAFYRHITEILRRSRAEQEHVVKVADAAGSASESSFLDRVAGVVDLDPDTAAMIARMPAPLRRAVEFYVGHAEQIRGRVFMDDSGDTDAQKLHKLTGFPLRFDFETELRAYLWEHEHVIA